MVYSVRMATADLQIYYEAWNDDTENSETILLCKKDVRAIGKLIPREFLCVISVHRKYHLEAPEWHFNTEEFLPANPVWQISCVIEKSFPNKRIVRVLILGPTVWEI